MTAIGVGLRAPPRSSWTARGIRPILSVMTTVLFGTPSVATAQDLGTVAEVLRSFDTETHAKQIVVDRALYPGPVLERLLQAGVDTSRPQYLVVVDRNPSVQALLIYLNSGDGHLEFIGAAPISTGLPTSFDHFDTPEGVFGHTPENPDFRAEGTRNENGIRGYGVRGMRVFDLGWQQSSGWPKGRIATMRLQMHATDPGRLESQLGSAQSKGCIRIPASVNAWLDLHGILDAAYDALPSTDRRRWVLRQDRSVVAHAGQYVIVLDSGKLLRDTNVPAPSLTGSDAVGTDLQGD